MEHVLAEMLRKLDEVHAWVGDFIGHFGRLLLVVAALVIVVSCLVSAVNQLMRIHNDREVLAAVVLGADAAMAMALLNLAKASDALGALYLMGALLAAVGVRLGAAKLGK